MATTPPTTIETDSPEFNAAFAFVMQVKDRFADHVDVFEQFLSHLGTLQACGGDVDRVALQARVAELFDGHDDLVQGFKTFSHPAAAQ